MRLLEVWFRSQLVGGIQLWKTSATSKSFQSLQYGKHVLWDWKVGWKIGGWDLGTIYCSIGVALRFSSDKSYLRGFFLEKASVCYNQVIRVIIE